MYLTLTRSRLAALFFSVLLLMTVIGDFTIVRDQPENAGTNAQRLDFLTSLGCVPQETARSSREIVLPADAAGIGETYMELQRKAGYRLDDYLGCRVWEYIYPVSLGEDAGAYAARLLVCHGRVIGGDISPERRDGTVLPLIGITEGGSHHGTATTG